MKITHIDLDIVSPTGQTEHVFQCELDDGVFDIHDPINCLATLFDEELWHENGEAYTDAGETASIVKAIRSGKVTKWDENEFGVAINIDDAEGYYTFMFSIDKKEAPTRPQDCDEVMFGSIQGPMKDNEGYDWYTFLYHFKPSKDSPATVIQRGCTDCTTWEDEATGDVRLNIYDEDDVPEECLQLVEDLDEYCAECHRRAPVSNSNIP